MSRILNVSLAIAAVGVLAHARPASACGAQQKTTTKAEEKVVPQQKAATADSQQNAKRAKARAAQNDAAQAKNEPAPRAPQK